MPLLSFSQSIDLSFNVFKTDFKTPCDSTKINYIISDVNHEKIYFTDSISFTSNQQIIHFKIQQGQFHLIIESEGYFTETLPFQLNETDLTKVKIQIGNVLLLKSTFSKVLEAATITGIKKDMIQTIGNKVHIQFKNNDILTISNLYDAIKKLPGTFISPSGDITYKGKGVSVYLDGIPSNLSGPNLTNFLLSYPATSVERIEINANPGAAYDANLQGVIFDIITQGTTAKWIAGSISLNYGRNLNDKLSPSLVLNGRRKRYYWQMQTGYNHIESTYNNELKQQFTYFQPIKQLTTSIHQQSTDKTLYFKPSISFKLSPTSTLLFNYNIYSSNSTKSIVSGLNSTENFVDYLNNATNNGTGLNQEFIVKYKKTLDTHGKSIELTGYTGINSGGNQMKSSQRDNGTNLYSLYKFTNNVSTSYAKLDINLPYTFATVNFGSKFNIEDNSNLGRYNVNNTNTSLFTEESYNSQLDFQFVEKNLAFYTEAMKNIKKFTFGAGVRWENYEVNRSSSLFSNTLSSKISNLFPNAYVTYQINPSVQTNLSYTKKISIPSASQYDPNNGSFYDKYYASKGNIYLKPNFYDNLNLSITAFDYLQLSVDYTHSNNENLQMISTIPNSIQTTQTSVNFSSMDNISIFGSLPVPFGMFKEGKQFFQKAINPDAINYLFVYTSYNQTNIKGYTFPTRYEPFWSSGLNSHFVLPKGFKLNINYSYSTKGYYQIYYINAPIHFADIIVSKTFLKRKLTTSFQVTDPFNTNYQQLKTTGTNLDVATNQKQDTRVFRVNLTYSFGKHRRFMNENTVIDTDKKENKGGKML